MKHLSIIFILCIGLAKAQCSFPILNPGVPALLNGQCLDSVVACVTPACGQRAYTVTIPAGFDGWVAISGQSASASVVFMESCMTKFVKDTCIMLNPPPFPSVTIRLAVNDTTTMSVISALGNSVSIQFDTLAGQPFLPIAAPCMPMTSIVEPIPMGYPLIDIMTGQVVTNPVRGRVYAKGKKKLIIY